MPLPSSKGENMTNGKTKTRLHLAVLCGLERDRWINPFLFLGVITALQNPDYLTSIVLEYNVSPVEEARNRAVIQAKKQGADWLLMIDNDIAPPPNFLDVLGQAGPEHRIISLPALQLYHGIPVPVTMLNLNGQGYSVEPGPGFCEVAQGGGGCLFIHREVMEKVPAPLFRWQLNPDGPGVISEDYFFCEKARKAGFKVWTHGDFAVTHYHQVDLGEIARMLRENPDFVRQAVIGSVPAPGTGEPAIAMPRMIQP
jgi:hypothetical protein